MCLKPFSLAIFLLVIPLITDAKAPSSKSLSKCPNKCGNISIPYPFGIADGCFRRDLQMFCNTSSTPPILSFAATESFIIKVSLEVIIMKSLVAIDCASNLNPLGSKPVHFINLDYTATLAYTISNRNKLVAIGCDAATEYSFDTKAGFGGCSSTCTAVSDVVNGSCTGNGCCETSIPKGFKTIYFGVGRTLNLTSINSISPCSYAFLIDRGQNYSFKSTDLRDFYNKTMVPVALDWAIGNETCNITLNSPDYACGGNSHCLNSTNGQGYLCECSDGYEGNPYLSDGCKDIDECNNPSLNDCSDICTNTEGSYNCFCPIGTFGDGRKPGKGCIKEDKPFPLKKVILESSLGFFFLLVSLAWLAWMTKKRIEMKRKEKFFKNNGGLLLQQKIASCANNNESTPRIFTTEELKTATNNYNPSQLLGTGGSGDVYKGTLQDTNVVVAIKKSKSVDKIKMEEFINEIVILSQVVHKNVVRILGCCLETDVPLLVYEFVPNGTLFDRIHDDNHGSLSWESRLKIAAEVAGAIAYLHHSATRPVFHRDIKSTNVLLDENFVAKVSDFGASRMVALEQDQVRTLIHGTQGYLDPDYMHTGRLTARSDVYSYGVVLAELLTGMKAYSLLRSQEDRNLSVIFLRAMADGRLMEVVEPRVRSEGNQEEIKTVSDIISKCLAMNGRDRPQMNEIEAKLEELIANHNNTSLE